MARSMHLFPTQLSPHRSPPLGPHCLSLVLSKESDAFYAPVPHAAVAPQVPPPGSPPAGPRPFEGFLTRSMHLLPTSCRPTGLLWVFPTGPALSFQGALMHCMRLGSSGTCRGTGLPWNPVSPGLARLEPRHCLGRCDQRDAGCIGGLVGPFRLPVWPALFPGQVWISLRECENLPSHSICLRRQIATLSCTQEELCPAEAVVTRSLASPGIGTIGYGADGADGADESGSPYDGIAGSFPGDGGYSSLPRVRPLFHRSGSHALPLSCSPAGVPVSSACQTACRVW